MLQLYLEGKPNNNVYNPVNIDMYRYAQNRPILLTDPNGMWEDKSITVGYDNKGVQRQATVNMGTVTEGDTLVKLAEMQLKNETGGGKFTGKEVEKKVEQIKQINNLKSDTIKVGQNLILGVSNDKVIGERGIQSSNVDLLIMGGIGYGLTKAGIAAARMIANAVLSTDVGITASLYGGAIAAAAKAGIQNSTLIMNAIQSMPGGNMMLMYGPEICRIGYSSIDFISAFIPGLYDYPKTRAGQIGTIISLLYDIDK